MSRWKAIGYAALAVGFGFSAFEQWSDGKSSDPINGLPGRRRRRAFGLAGGPRAKIHEVRTIEQRVKLLQDLICKGGASARLHELASAIVSKKCRRPDGGVEWCTKEKDGEGEVRALFSAVRDPKSPVAIRYTSDMAFVDTFTSAERSVFKKHSGDCDDLAVSLGSLLVAIGHPVKIRVIQTQGKASWSHVYLLTPRNHLHPEGQWIPVDASVDKPLGWEAPGAAQVAATGKPAGMVIKVRDFDVGCGS